MTSELRFCTAPYGCDVGARKLNDEHRAFPGPPTVRRDFSVVQLHDVTGYRQPQAETTARAVRPRPPCTSRMPSSSSFIALPLISLTVSVHAPELISRT